MRSVKISAPAIQDERNGRTGAFVLCCPQRQKQRLYPAPFDVSADGIQKDCFKGFSVPIVHSFQNNTIDCVCNHKMIAKQPEHPKTFYKSRSAFPFLRLTKIVSLCFLTGGITVFAEFIRCFANRQRFFMHSRRGRRSRLSAAAFWHTPTAQDDLPLVLTAGARLPLCLWRQNIFFKGAANEKLRILTEGKFPCRAPSAGTHPIFVLTALPQRVA